MRLRGKGNSGSKQEQEVVKKRSKRRGAGIGAQIKEDQAMMLDLLNILTYMSSIATADIGRDEIFELAGQQDGITARLLKKIHLLARNYGYDYATACRLVSEEAHHPALKDFLIRFSNALATGEEEAKFLRGETEKMIEVYTNKYQSDVETLKKWTDGYSALLVSVMLIIAVFLISTMLFRMGNILTMAILSGTLFCFVAFFGVYVIYRVAPYEKMVHSLPVKSKEQVLAGRLSMFILPACMLISVILVAIDMKPWLIFLLVSLFLLPIGLLGMIDGKKIEKRDMDLSSFLKALGSTAGIMGSTLTQAMGHLDRKAVGSLGKQVERLRKRLVNGINPKISWYHFIGETGSELVHRSTRVFLDAIELGGDPNKIGAIVSQSALGIALLRAKRKLVSSGFVNLLIPLHATMCGVLVFIYQIMFSFNEAIVKMMQAHSTEVGGAMKNIPAGMGFNFMEGVDLAFIAKYVTIIVLVLSVANAFAAKFAAGGSRYTLCFYASIMFLLSAFVLFAIPMIANNIFSVELGT